MTLQNPLPKPFLSDPSSDPDPTAPAAPEETARDRLKRHRVAVAGQVWIPETWGKEDLLKDWIDGSAFEASLFPSGIVSARRDLAREANNNAPAATASAAAAGALRILNSC